MHGIKKSIAKGTVKAFAITSLICAIVSVLMLFVDLSDKVLGYISVALLALTCYMSAYFSTQIKRTKGLLQGLLCGGLIFVLTMLASIVLKKFVFSEMFFIKFLVCIASGIIGGIKGINTRHTNVT